MNAEIIAVGSELLLGQIINTNAQFLSKKLAEIGINVYFHTVVGDNAARLKEAIIIAENRADFIIFTGGLGPTKDDLTKETIAQHIGKELVTDKKALTSIEQYFVRTNRAMTENNKKQAIVLEGSTILQNDHGMAPGMLLHSDNHIYMLLPGPPKEMEPMFSTYAYPLLESITSKDPIFSRVLRFFGIGEASLETEIEDLIDQQTNPTIAPLASDGEVTLRLTAKHPSKEIAMKLINDIEEKILARVGSFFYGYDETSLVIEALNVLKSRGLTLACAESLTGGMFQQEITTISGASEVLIGGVICYSNDLKENLLQVPKEVLLSDGAVSSQCAVMLAENIQKITGADVGISFTGVAGPNESEGKPVGTVFIGLAIKEKPTTVLSLNLSGNRNAIRNRTVKHGFSYLIKSIG